MTQEENIINEAVNYIKHHNDEYTNCGCYEALRDAVQGVIGKPSTKMHHGVDMLEIQKITAAQAQTASEISLKLHAMTLERDELRTIVMFAQDWFVERYPLLELPWDKYISE